MTARVCSLGGCDRPHHARGYCKPHYRRVRRNGNLPPSDRVRLAILIAEEPDACWGWQGSPDSKGYARFQRGGRYIAAHRAAYQDFVGPIPDGLEIDHRCHNRTCCNPRHLRLATNKQNNENQAGPNRANTSGVRGVHWHKPSQKWVARVKHNGRRIYVGAFTSLAEAEAAVIAKRNELHTFNDADRV